MLGNGRSRTRTKSDGQGVPSEHRRQGSPWRCWEEEGRGCWEDMGPEPWVSKSVWPVGRQSGQRRTKSRSGKEVQTSMILSCWGQAWCWGI